MQGGSNTQWTVTHGGGGGGGYYGGSMGCRQGSWEHSGGGGGSGFTGLLLSADTLAGNFTTPANSGDKDLAPSLAEGGTMGKGGDGMVVIRY